MGNAAARDPSPSRRSIIGSNAHDIAGRPGSRLMEELSSNSEHSLLSSKLSNPTSGQSTAALGSSYHHDHVKNFFGLSTPAFSLAFSIYAILAFPEWSIRLWTSGVPLLCFLIFYGGTVSQLPNTHPNQRLPLVVGILLLYIIFSTSWLAHYILILITWPFVALLATANFTFLQTIVRRSIRRLGRDLHYFQNKIACFDIPALDIDVLANGMMVIEGLTFTLSAFTLEAHSIEVVLKVDDGLEVCLRTEKVISRLGRCVEVGDVYVTLKTEMDTGPGSVFAIRRANTFDMMKEFERPEQLLPDSLGDTIEMVKDVTDTQYLDEDESHVIQTYAKRLQYIHENTAINAARRRLLALADDKYSRLTVKQKKAMIASELQTAASITHPPTWSIAVSQLAAHIPAWVHKFNNRFPVILRTVLNIIAHLHPVKCNGVIGNVTGLFASGMLEQVVFKHYKNENKEISKLASRVQTWLETGNFVVQVSKINGVAQVPTIVSYNILASIKTSTVQVFKVLVAPEIPDSLLDIDDTVSIESVASNISNISEKSGVSFTIKDKVGIKKEEDKGISEVVRINGVSGTVEVPTMLLPHHEYLFPPPLASKGSSAGILAKVEEDVTVFGEEDDRLEEDVLVDAFDGRETAAGATDTESKDEVFVIATILASLPAQFNSTTLHFVTALLKASKLIEIERRSLFGRENCNGTYGSEEEEGGSGAATPTRSRSLSRVGTRRRMGNKVSKVMKRKLAGALDDAWIARLLGKLVGRAEGLKGEVGYKMPIPVDLGPRRLQGLGPQGTAVDYRSFGK
ncbi:hypothetical protein TWF718_010497 [Orbilia javanica]|uniref:Uncharacterized protein n=1 Tax=Orbilia javanica TaxID=47235 RepID=A0AAN8RL30_9PEZI